MLRFGRTTMHIISFLLGLSVTLFAGSPVQVNVVCNLPYDFNVATAVVWTGAAFELAVEAANQIYAPFLNISLRFLYNSSHRTCDDIAAESARWLSEYAYRETKPVEVNAIVTTPCTDAVGIQSLASQWDWLLFSNGLAQDDFLDNVRNPTAMAIAGTFRGYAVVLAEFLLLYQWSHVTVLLDIGLVVYKTLASSFLSLASSPDGLRYRLQMELCIFASTNGSMAKALDCAKKRSRVIYSTGKVAINLLIKSAEYGMDNGEYVFINVQPMQQNSYGRVDLFNHPDTRISMILRSFFYMTYGSFETNFQKQLNHNISTKTRSLYNRTFESGSPPLASYAVHASYDIVDILSAVVNGSLPSRPPASPWSGRDLLHDMINRTFVAQTMGDVYIGKARFLDLDIYAFSPQSSSMQRLGSWTWLTHGFAWTSDLAIDWPTTNGQPPSDIPACGFSGFDGICDQSNDTMTMAIGLSIAAILVIVSLAFVVKRWLEALREYTWLPRHLLRLPIPTVTSNFTSIPFTADFSHKHNATCTASDLEAAVKLKTAS